MKIKKKNSVMHLKSIFERKTKDLMDCKDFKNLRDCKYFVDEKDGGDKKKAKSKNYSKKKKRFDFINVYEPREEE